MAHAQADSHSHILNSIADSFMAAAKVSSLATLCIATPAVLGFTVGAIAGLADGSPHEAVKRGMEAAAFTSKFGLPGGALVLGGGLLNDFVFTKDKKQELVAYFMGLVAVPTALLGVSIPVRGFLDRPEVKPEPKTATMDCVEICPLIPPGQPGSHYPAPLKKGL